MKTAHQYQGYLSPWLSDIIELWNNGHTTKQIATIMRKEIEKDPNRIPGYAHSNYYKYWGPPRPSSSMIHYIIERIGHGPVEKQWHPHDYPTAGRWRLLLPVSLAHKQARWERLRSIRNMQKLGFTLEQIGRRIGISRERVRQLTIKPLPQCSPLELFLQDEKIHLRELAKSPTLLSIVTMDGMHSRFRDK